MSNIVKCTIALQIPQHKRVFALCVLEVRDSTVEKRLQCLHFVVFAVGTVGERNHFNCFPLSIALTRCRVWSLCPSEMRTKETS